MSATSILGVIQHYQRSIEKCQTDETRLLHCISKLYKLPIKVEHLQETGIGKTVNSLRKFDGEIGTAAKTLVAKWKAMVAAEEEPMETSCHQDDEFKSNGKGTDSDDDDNDDHKDHKKNIDVNSNNNKHHSETKKTQSSSKHRGDVKHRDESVENSSSKSQHRSTSSSQIEVVKNKHENKSNFSSSSKDKNNTTDKHHRKHEKSEKSDNKPEKSKDSYHDSSDKKQDKQKNTASSSHKTSKLHKEENSYSNETHHHNSKREKTSHSDEKESAHHKESLKHENRSSSSSKERARNSQKNDSNKHEKHKSSSKDDRVEKHEKSRMSSKDKDRDLEHGSEKKKHSSPAKHTSPSTKTTVEKPSTSAEASSERKRKHNSDQDLNNAKSPKTKLPKPNKVVEETNEVEDDEEGIDSSMGANFADVLGMLNVPGKKLKKTSNTTKSPTAGASISSGNKTSSQSKDSQSNSSSSKLNGMKPSTSSSLKKLDTKPDLLSSSTKLEPLDPSIAMELPTISTNYKPLPLSQNVLDVVFPSSSTSSIPTKPPVRTMTEFEAISQGISSKTQRTKIYSGVRSGQLLHAPTLFDLCIRVLQKNIDALEYTGGVPFEVLRPVLERASPQQLLVFEEYNPYLMEDCDILWQIHVQRHYRSHKRQELESWREMFLRCQEDQERKLNTLAESIKQSQKIISAPVRKTQMAFVDSMVKPPRNVQRKQEQFGTKSKLTATPAARVAALSSVTPNAAKTGDARLRVAASVRDNAQVANIVRPLKKAPLMAKTLQFMRGRHKR